ncbi:transporter, MotA/TolQ/ExbB proton channel family, putative [Verrucomicrobiia bacterium DG1235]|nr:transporter, MotA/TolQ/ExbB proton channel family, putative [Verrucomicrobiae bacterium DG1235]
MERSKNLWEAAQFEELAKLAEGRNCVMSRVLSSIIKHRSKPFDRVSMIASNTASSAMKRELQRIYPLNIIATLSPLIGLFGTVAGMITSFRMIVITGVSGDATIVADGISQALVTTAAGLIVGIPTLAFYHYFKNRLSRFSSVIEDNSNTVLYDWLLDTPINESDKH